MNFPKVDRLLRSGVKNGLFTGAVLEVARDQETLISRSYGTPGGPCTDEVTPATLFDLASLTKVLATTPCWMVLAEQDSFILDRKLISWFPQCPDDKKSITPRHLLGHVSGLPAWRPYYLYQTEAKTRKQFTLDKILAEPLVYEIGAGCLYSDLGFMLLGFIIEAEAGLTLDELAREQIYKQLGLEEQLKFTPSDGADSIAYTRKDEPPGIVNDLNARALDGTAGHAGLFGTATAVTQLAKEMLNSLKSETGFFSQTVSKTFCRRFPFPVCPRTLGFDTPSPEGSSSGQYFSPDSIGHTGFTGTSLWIDPAADLIVTLLTNRVFMGESDFRIKDFRPMLHNAVREGLEAM